MDRPDTDHIDSPTQALRRRGQADQESCLSPMQPPGEAAPEVSASPVSQLFTKVLRKARTSAPAAVDPSPTLPEHGPEAGAIESSCPRCKATLVNPDGLGL